jgi:hypothetical protein
MKVENEVTLVFKAPYLEFIVRAGDSNVTIFLISILDGENISRFVCSQAYEFYMFHALKLYLPTVLLEILHFVDRASQYNSC